MYSCMYILVSAMFRLRELPDKLGCGKFTVLPVLNVVILPEMLRMCHKLSGSEVCIHLCPRLFSNPSYLHISLGVRYMCVVEEYG